MIEGHKEETKYSLLNRLAELIQKTIGEKESTRIEIVDCENFIVVKGVTTSKEILDLNLIKEKFIEKFPENSENLKIGNTIDLIKYGEDVEDVTIASFQFFNSENLELKNCSDDFSINPLVYKSSFPFGYSNDQGKSLYFYAKHIAYNLQTKYTWDKITICIPKKDQENDFEIFVDTCQNSNLDLKSAILDAFDFNYLSLDKAISESDWWVLIFQELDPPAVKSLNEDFIIF